MVKEPETAEVRIRSKVAPSPDLNAVNWSGEQGTLGRESGSDDGQ